MARPGDDQLTVTLRRNDMRLVLGALIAEAGMHSREGRHATAAWAHEVAAKIADALGDYVAGEQQRGMAGACSNEWHESQKAKRLDDDGEAETTRHFAGKTQEQLDEEHGYRDGPTDPPRFGPY